MKTTSLLISAALVTLLANMAPMVLAAEAPAGTKTDAAATKKVKPHSHAEEKTGAPAQPVTETSPGKDDAKKKDQHIHSRDGK